MTSARKRLLIAQAGGPRYRVRSLAVLAPVMGPGRSREVAALRAAGLPRPRFEGNRQQILILIATVTRRTRTP